MPTWKTRNSQPEKLITLTAFYIFFSFLLLLLTQDILAKDHYFVTDTLYMEIGEILRSNLIDYL
jgi:hypothetical protein